jgi:hypothetical protein
MLTDPSTRISHKAVAERAIAKPGRWTFARYYPGLSTAHTVANQVRNARLTAYKPAGSFESRVSYDETKGYKVSVKYTG